MAKKKNDPIQTIFNALTELGWPDLKVNPKRLVVDRKTKREIISKKGTRYTLSLIWYDRDNDEFNARSGLNTVIFDDTTPFDEIVYISRRRGYGLSQETLVRAILQIGAGRYYSDVRILDVDQKHSRISFSKRTKTLKIPSKKYLSITKDAEGAYQQANKYRGALSRYLANQLAKKHGLKDTQATTTIEKGEFGYLIHRFNLSTKTSRRDYEKYLGSDDVGALQRLFTGLLREEVFQPGFLRELDDYFIREKLESIVVLGRQILDLGSQDLSTQKALEVLEALGEKSIGQLETLWQRYFEKYLLYLIFSYKEIYPKVQLELDAEKRYPDFIGINHYYGVDAIEIKTHLAPALMWDGSHGNFAFSGELSKAIIQTMNYLDAIKQERFSDDDDRARITETTFEENLYRPRGIIVISSRERLVKSAGSYEPSIIRRDFTKLRNSLHNIEILTFEEILDMADHYRKNIVQKQEDVR